MKLEIIERQDDITQVALVGRLDVAGMREIDLDFHAETAARNRPAVVDLSGMDFIASLGIGLLISCARSLERRGGKMVLLKPQKMVEETLQIAGIHELMPIVDDLDAAVELAAGR